MAIHLMEISGKLANVIFYKKDGRNFVRLAPSKLKRTKNMKARSRNFGTASRNGRMIRSMLSGLLPFPKDRLLQNHFTGAIARWIGKREIKTIPAEGNLIYLNGFQFNEKYRLSQRLRVELSVTQVSDNMLQLYIPAFVPTGAIIAPAGTVSVTLQVCAAPVGLATCMAYPQFSMNVEIPYTPYSRAPQTINLPVNTQSGTLVITACALKYTISEHEKTTISKDPAFMPAGVVDAKYC